MSRLDDVIAAHNVRNWFGSTKWARTVSYKPSAAPGTPYSIQALVYAETLTSPTQDNSWRTVECEFRADSDTLGRINPRQDLGDGPACDEIEIFGDGVYWKLSRILAFNVHGAHRVQLRDGGAYAEG